MPMLRRSPSRVLTRSAARARIWKPTLLNFVFTAAPEDPDRQDALLILETEINEMTRPTLVRIRGMCSPLITAAGASSAPVYIFAGIGVQNERAVNLGAGALPSPYTDGDWNGWVWQGQYVLNTAAPAILSVAANSITIVDGSGQRRMGEDDLLFASVECFGRPADTDVAINMALRLLFLDNGGG